MAYRRAQYNVGRDPKRREDAYALPKLARNTTRLLGILHEVLASRKLSELECDASSHRFSANQRRPRRRCAGM
jgi:hypothetical protein